MQGASDALRAPRAPTPDGEATGEGRQAGPEASNGRRWRQPRRSQARDREGAGLGPAGVGRAEEGRAAETVRRAIELR